MDFRYVTRYLSVFILSLVFALASAPKSVGAQEACSQIFEIENKVLAQAHLKAADRLQSGTLLAFAREHNLPTRVLEVGPSDRKIKRLFVAVDVSNEALMDAYYKRFNLDTPINDKVAGTLVLDYTKESITSPEHYVPAIVRRTANPKDPGYRWGKPDPYIES